MYKHILVPTDGSRLSEEAAAAAIQMAKALGARISALHVVPEPAGSGLDAWTHDDEKFEEHLEKVLEARGNEYLSTVREMARSAGVRCECALVRGESPSAEILVAARDRGCDLIVMASHGRSGSDAVILASETVKVMTLGELPVLVHRAPRGAGAAAQAAAG
ncbi:MAG TPA: universal stress protein [Usitatibacter sp.]|nr:universal stress protein [Usitatibacter sp.]